MRGICYYSFYISIHLVVKIIMCANNSNYMPAENIAINCGSSSTESPPFDGRNWTGDIGSRYISSTPEKNSTSTTSQASVMSPAVPEVPYRKARIFLQSKFTYTFNVTPGPKFIRLHFYPASYTGGFELPSKAFLTVTAAGGQYTLLSNFSAYLTAEYFKVQSIMREFIVNVNRTVLDITFAPSSDYAYAFVNGIEVVSMPLHLYIGGGDHVPGLPLVGYASVQFFVDETFALETCYRINVGGNDIQPKDDTGMFRSWNRDEAYIFGAAYGVAPQKFPLSVMYTPKVPAYTAPENIYRTARSMGRNRYINLNYNLSWVYPVDSGFRYLIRLHFCEIIVEVKDANFRVFMIFINNQTAEKEADVIYWSGGVGTAVYKDYVVMVPALSVAKQDLWIELHPNSESKPVCEDAILNGVEIFKLSNNDGNLAGLNPPEAEFVNGSSPSESSPKLSRNPKNIIAVVTGCSLGGLVILILLCLLVAFRLLKKPKKKRMPLPLCRYFSIEEIKAATGNFDEALVIGTGGFGKVYKGYIGDQSGTIAGIKRGNLCSKQGEFQAEISTLSQLRYHNLVSLIGHCTEENEMILVYDYMANGTVHDHLHCIEANTDKSPLSWEQRLKICIGAARGLHYLHTGSKAKIIHRDVKTTNILLDENLVAKVSDFGLSKAAGPRSMSFTHVSTDIKGSVGYMDPEYYKRRRLTEKSDVYSFGVVLWEVLSARPPVSPIMEEDDEDHLDLAEWALSCYQNGTIDQTIDPYLKGKIRPESLAKYVDIAKNCLVERGAERPLMAEVLQNLEQALKLQNNVAIDGNTELSATATAIGINGPDNSDKTPGVEFSDLMTPIGR